MKLTKAFEILTNYLRGDEPDNAPDLPDSIRLGIETIKWRQQCKARKIPYAAFLLPGETED